MVEYSPATRAARVRFPDDAHFLLCGSRNSVEVPITRKFMRLHLPSNFTILFLQERGTDGSHALYLSGSTQTAEKVYFPPCINFQWVFRLNIPKYCIAKWPIVHKSEINQYINPNTIYSNTTFVQRFPSNPAKSINCTKLPVNSAYSNTHPIYKSRDVVTIFWIKYGLVNIFSLSSILGFHWD